MHPRYSLLVTDLDGTLLTSTNTLSAVAKESIAYFRKCGGRFTVATGRSLMECKELLDELHVTEPVVVYNGAAIYLPDKDKMEALFTLPQNKIEKLLQEITSLPIRVDILLHSPTSIYVRRMRISTREILDGYGARYLIFPPGLRMREPFLKIQMIGTVEEIHYLKEWAKDHPLASQIEFIQTADEYFEILPLEATKGAALKKVLEHLNIPPAKTAALGDHCNDISMFQEVSLAAAVGNAHPLARKHATHVVPSNDKDGIATLIDHHLLMHA